MFDRYNQNGTSSYVEDLIKDLLTVRVVKLKCSANTT